MSDDQAPKLSRQQQAIEDQRRKVEQATQRLKDMQSRARVQQRKDDTRRKIIAGALALEHTEKNPDGTFAKKMLALLDEYVLKAYERSLFGMAPLPPDPANQNTGQNAGQPGLKGQFPS